MFLLVHDYGVSVKNEKEEEMVMDDTMESVSVTVLVTEFSEEEEVEEEEAGRETDAASELRHHV